MIMENMDDYVMLQTSRCKRLQQCAYSMEEVARFLPECEAKSKAFTIS